MGETKPFPPCQEIPTTARAAVDALVLHHLNPLLRGRQALVERVEELRACGDQEATAREEAVLLFLELAYRDALKLLKRALSMGTCAEVIQ